MKEVLIVGAGATGHALAANMALNGYHNIMFEENEYQSSLEAVKAVGGIEIIIEGQSHFSKIYKTTFNIKEALENCCLVIVAVPATRHERIFELFLPHLRDDHVIVITPGNAGSLLLAEMMRRTGFVSRCTIAEVESNLLVCRMDEPGRVELVLPPRPRYIAAFPATETPRAIKEIEGISEVRPAAHVLETALNLPNLDCHLIGSLLNTGGIEKAAGNFYFYDQALTPSVLRAIEALHRERVAVLEAVGGINRFSLDLLKALAGGISRPEFETFKRVKAPSDMRHRFIEEDASTGISMMVSLGELTGIDMPLSRSLLHLASAVNGVDYWKTGRTLEKLGLGKMSLEELKRYLLEGTRSNNRK